MKFIDDTFNMKEIEKVIKTLKDNNVKVRIGIVGESQRNEEETGDAPTNATISLWAEMGTENSPARSWLRMPLAEKLFDNLKNSGFFNDKTFRKVVKERSFVKFGKKMGVVAEETIQQAFDTDGFGKWPKSDMSNKKVQQTLVETQQLRRAVTSEVKS